MGTLATASQSTTSKQSTLDPQVFTLAEFCGLLGISYTTGHLMAQAGTLPVMPVKIGRQYLFPKALVHKLLGIESTDRSAA